MPSRNTSTTKMNRPPTMICHHEASTPLRKNSAPLTRKVPTNGADDGAAAAHRGPDHALDREHGPGVEEGDDPDPGRIERACGRGHEGGDAEHEDTVIGDVVAHEFRAHVVVADRFEHGSDARMRQRPRSNEEHDDDRKDEPEKRGRGVVRIVGDAVEAAGIGLILDDEVLEDERFGERDHRAIDAVDVPLEGDDAEQEAPAASEPPARRKRQTAC